MVRAATGGRPYGGIPLVTQPLLFPKTNLTKALGFSVIVTLSWLCLNEITTPRWIGGILHKSSMLKLQRILLWVTLGLIVILTAGSIYGAFIGAKQAQGFFSSPPMAVVWLGLCTVLIVGMLRLRSLLRVPALLLLHVGTLAVLIGGLLGSDVGRDLQNRWLGRDIIPEGRLALVNGQQDNRMYLKQDPNQLRELPFTVALDEFRKEHYPGKLYVQDNQTEKTWVMEAVEGAVYDLGPAHGQLKITGVFNNARININQDPRIYEYSGPGSNPALTVQLEKESAPRYVFAQRPSMPMDSDQSPLTLQYRQGMVQDYISEVKIIQDDRIIASKAIEVNHPLRVQGYHLYQTSYGQDPQNGMFYTVLSVVPDAGLTWVYAGYILLCLGVIWQSWFRSIGRTLRLASRKEELKHVD